ncbi:MAG: hypothetical protein EOO04_39415 [Chitinophagaceae bacterium]|nr:MAG: hypothetical protein EOO04_39415 [Chitinophagaceae bacterium]
MEKFNEATPARPEGDRILNAAVVFIDLEDYYRQLKQEDTWQKNDRNGITTYKDDQVTIVVTCLREGAEVIDNVVDALVTVQVLEGALDVEHEGRKTELSDNNILVFHRGVKHSIRAKTEASVIITTIK